MLCEPVEPRRLLAGIVSGATQTGSGDKTFTVSLGADSDVLIATHTTGGLKNVNVSLVNTSVGSSVGYAIINGAGRTGSFRVASAGTYELRIDRQDAGTAGKWSTTLFTRTSKQRDDDSKEDFVTGKTYGGKLSSNSDVDWWVQDQPQDAFTGAAFGVTDGASSKNFTLAHVSPDGRVENSSPNNTEAWWSNSRAENWIAGAKQYYIVTGKTGGYAVSFTSLPEARDASVDDRATIKSGQTYSGRITSGDQDIFPVVVAKGAKISATLKAAKGSSLMPSLRLVRADGVELSADDDGDTARVSSGAAKSNTIYYLVARGGWLSNGKYSLNYKLSSGSGTGAVNDRGELSIKGGKGNDDIAVVVSPSSGTVSVTINKKTTEYSRGVVRSLRIDGGEGNDHIDYNSTSLPGYVTAGSGDDTVLAGGGNDTIVGNAGRNVLIGNAGDDQMKGSNGRDTLIGAAGDDRLYGGGGNDLLDSGPGIDRLWGDDGDDSLIGGAANDKLYGGRGIDRLSGNAGKDLLDGGSDKDTVLDKESGDTLKSIEKS